MGKKKEKFLKSLEIIPLQKLDFYDEKTDLMLCVEQNEEEPFVQLFALCEYLIPWMKEVSASLRGDLYESGMKFFLRNAEWIEELDADIFSKVEALMKDLASASGLTLNPQFRQWTFGDNLKEFMQNVKFLAGDEETIKLYCENGQEKFLKAKKLFAECKYSEAKNTLLDLIKYLEPADVIKRALLQHAKKEYLDLFDKVKMLTQELAKIKRQHSSIFAEEKIQTSGNGSHRSISPFK